MKYLSPGNDSSLNLTLLKSSETLVSDRTGKAGPLNLAFWFLQPQRPLAKSPNSD